MFTKPRHVVALLFAAAFLMMHYTPPCFAQVAEEKSQPPLFRVPDRPKVGLVLSGGGARGVAHVGGY